MPKYAIIIGAGPAGLTAALELLRQTDILPIVLEASDEIGGLSRTIRHNGNRMDIGGHRFFSKSDRVMQWWMDLMPLEAGANELTLAYQGQQRVLSPREAPATKEAADADLVMLVRPRKSRIYYLRRFFDYPIKLSASTFANLGPVRTLRIGLSYLASRLWPIRQEKSLEDFLINRFGRELYLTFFKSYTEKVWGTPCSRISADWGAQRIKGLSLTTALKHFLKTLSTKRRQAPAGDLAQKGTDTSLIERFLYPKFGPGQLWEHVAEEVLARGGKIEMHCKVDRVEVDGDRIAACETVDRDGRRHRFVGDYFLSTMPMRELVRAMEAGGALVPGKVREVSEGLQYRDFITIGVLANKLNVHEPGGGTDNLIKDTWIYIQEPDVLLGRLHIYNNWSPHLVADPTKVWLGLEYFCAETDPLWAMPDEDLKRFAIAELEQIGILQSSEVLDAYVVRVPKSYPAYFGTYDRFHELRTWVDGFENLHLIGRNGMHKYNNQDHSMLTAMAVVDGLAAGCVDKRAVWNINIEQDYHEARSAH